MPALDLTPTQSISYECVHRLDQLSSFIPANLFDSRSLTLKAAKGTDIVAHLPASGRWVACVLPSIRQIVCPVMVRSRVASGTVNRLGHAVRRAGGGLLAPVEIVAVGAREVDAAVRFDDARPEPAQFSRPVAGRFAGHGPGISRPVDHHGALDVLGFPSIPLSEHGQGRLRLYPSLCRSGNQPARGLHVLRLRPYVLKRRFVENDASGGPILLPEFG